jgi:hypothetical protein
VYGIGAGIFAFAAIAAFGRMPALDCGTARVRQTHPHPARTVLTVYGIGAGIFAFAAIAAFGRMPALDCGTAPVRQTHPRPARAVLMLCETATRTHAAAAASVAAGPASTAAWPTGLSAPSGASRPASVWPKHSRRWTVARFSPPG